MLVKSYSKFQKNNIQILKEKKKKRIIIKIRYKYYIKVENKEITKYLSH